MPTKLTDKQRLTLHFKKAIADMRVSIDSMEAKWGAMQSHLSTDIPTDMVDELSTEIADMRFSLELLVTKGEYGRYELYEERKEQNVVAISSTDDPEFAKLIDNLTAR